MRPRKAPRLDIANLLRQPAPLTVGLSGDSEVQIAVDFHDNSYGIAGGHIPPFLHPLRDARFASRDDLAVAVNKRMRQHALLSDVPVFSDVKQAAIIIAEHAVKETPLKGYSGEAMSAWMADAVGSLMRQPELASHHRRADLQLFSEDMRALNRLEKISLKALEKASTDLVGASVDLAIAFIQSIDTLNGTNTVLLPGGWGGVQGHAVIYEVARPPELNGNYRMFVYNTGDGQPYNTGAALNNDVRKLKHAARFVIDDIPADAWGTRNHPSIALRALAEARLVTISRVYWHTHYRVQVNSVDLFRRILPALGGRFSEEPVEPWMFITGQRSGSCAFRVLTAVLRYRVAEDYKPINFWLRSMGIRAELKRLETTPHVTVTERVVLQQATDNFASLVTKASDRNELDGNALMHAAEVTGFAKDFLASNPPPHDDIEWSKTLAEPHLDAAQGASIPEAWSIGYDDVREEVGARPPAPSFARPQNAGELRALLASAVRCMRAEGATEVDSNAQLIGEVVELLPLDNLALMATMNEREAKGALGDLALLADAAFCAWARDDGSNSDTYICTSAALLCIGVLADVLTRRVMADKFDA